MRQQQFIFTTQPNDPFVLGMRLWRTFVRYISPCLCSPHSLQRLAVCYLVLGWLFKRVWVMFQRPVKLCNYFRTHSLAMCIFGIITFSIRFPRKYMFVITVRQFSQKVCAFKGARGYSILPVENSLPSGPGRNHLVRLHPETSGGGGIA